MRIFLIIAFLLAFSAPGFTAEPPKPKEDHLQVRLISPVTATGDKATVPVAMEVKLQPKWDTYWRTPGDAGLAPALEWKGSENFTSADMKFPLPKRQTLADLENIIYTDAVTFPIDVTLAKQGEPLSLKLHVEFLVCNQICVPEKHDVTLELPAGEAKASADATAYQEALDTLPKKAGDDFQFDKVWLDYDPANKNYVVVEATAPKAPGRDADMFIENPAGLTYGKPAITYDAKTKKVTLRAEIHSNDPMDAIKSSLSKEAFTFTYADKGGGFEGTLPLGDKPAGAGPLKTPHDAPIVMEKMESISLYVLFCALLGGLILNLMPCVLPVLSIKILSVVSHGGKDNKKTIFRNFMASAAGIIFSFWVLAGVLVALRSAGDSIGWGIQFQHTWFVALLTFITLFFAANMWGLFEIPLPRFIAKNIPAK